MRGLSMMGGPHPQQAAVMQTGTLPTVLQTDGGFDINSIMNLMLMMMVMVMKFSQQYSNKNSLTL